METKPKQKSKKGTPKSRALNETIGSREDRSENDFYSTPAFVTEALLKRVEFPGIIYEPAAGDGAIAKVLKEHGYSVITSDIVEREGFTPDKKLDFLGSEREDFDLQGKPLSIVTNPPFTLATEFILQAQFLKVDRAAFLLRTCFLEGKDRFEKLFDRDAAAKGGLPLSLVLQFSGRIHFGHPGKKERETAKIAFSWFVFDKDHFGFPRIDWIPPAECKGE